MVVGFVYINMQIKYNNAQLAKQHKVTKRMAIKDTEYEEILKQETDQLNGQKSRGINCSIVDDDDEDDQW